MVSFTGGLVEEDLAPLLAYERQTCNFGPTIHIQDTTARALQTTRLLSLLNDIDVTRNAITSLVQKLEYLSFDLRRQEAAVKAALSPVMGIPPELLREIFLIVMAQAPHSRTSLALSHVNSHWRAVSLGTRELWTIIQVPDHLPGSDMFSVFGLRSGGLALDIARLPPRPYVSIPLDISPDPTDISRVVSIALHSGVSSCDWLRSLTSGALPISLQNLTLATHPLEKSSPAVFFSGSNAMITRSLRIDGEHIVNNSGDAMDHLEELSISNCTQIGVGKIFRQLQDMPLLRRLELYGIVSSVEEDDMDIDLLGHNHRITSLVIDTCDGGVWLAIEVWSMPNLAELTVTMTESVDHELDDLTDIWNEMLFDSFNLKSINLRASGYALRAFCRFLSIKDSPQRLVLPELRSLNISAGSGGSYDVKGFRGMLESRYGTDSGVAKLQHFGVSDVLVPTPKAEQSLREIVGTLTVLPDVWPPACASDLLGSIQEHKLLHGAPKL